MFGYQWLEGSIRVDLDSSGRGVWADMLALASISRRAGYLERSIGIPYSEEELADKFMVDLKEVQKVIFICINEGRLARDENNTLFIRNWNKYQDIPFGSTAPAKTIKKEVEKSMKSEDEKIAIQRKLDNLHPDVSRDVLSRDFHDVVYEHSTGEKYEPKDTGVTGDNTGEQEGK